MRRFARKRARLEFERVPVRSGTDFGREADVRGYGCHPADRIGTSGIGISATIGAAGFGPVSAKFGTRPDVVQLWAKLALAVGSQSAELACARPNLPGISRGKFLV